MALIVAGGLLLALTVYRILQCWSNDSHLEHVAGVWVTEAMDFSHGLFYRAPYGPYGYGGTRYFPLFFTLHGLLIRIFGNWRWTGYSLSAVSVVLLLAAVYSLARRLGARPWLAAGATFTVLAGSSVQDALLTIREDAMAAMLNIWALVLCLDPVEENATRRRLVFTAALFTLAFAAKETTIFGFAAVFLCLLLNRQFRRALWLFVFTATGYALVLLIIFLGSGGRALQVFRLVATPGVSLASLIASPINMVDEMGGYPAEMILLVLALAVLVAGGARNLRRLASLFFVCALLATIALFSSDGIAGNHLIDLYVASVILVVAWAVRAEAHDFAISAAACICLVIWLSLMATRSSTDSIPVRAQMQQVVNAIGPTNKLILAENPLLPILAGQRPYVLDPFSFRLMEEDDSSIGDPMWQMMREHQFAAVVFMHDPNTPEGRDFYSGTHFGEDFMEELQKDYRPAGTVGGQYLYLPRTNPAN